MGVPFDRNLQNDNKMWVAVVCAFIIGIIIGILLIFTHFYHDKDRGKKFFEDSEKPFNKKHQKCIIISRECLGCAMDFLLAFIIY